VAQYWLEKVAIYEGIADWGGPMSCRLFWAVLASFVLYVHTNCYFPTSDHNYDILIRFGDPRSNNLVIRLHFYAVTLISDVWHWTFVVHWMSGDQTLFCTKFDWSRTIRGKVIDDLAMFSWGRLHQICGEHSTMLAASDSVLL